MNEAAGDAATRRWVRVGRIGKAFGLRGEAVIHYFGDGPERFAPGARVHIVTPDGRVAAVVARARQLPKKYVAAFEGRESIDAVQRWVGCPVEVPAETLPRLEEGRYYHFQLLGLEVFSHDGAWLGRVAEILETGSNDVYVVRGEAREVLIPAIADAIATIDIERGRIDLKALSGLLEP